MRLSIVRATSLPVLVYKTDTCADQTMVMADWLTMSRLRGSVLYFVGDSGTSVECLSTIPSLRSLYVKDGSNSMGHGNVKQTS
jgi:hypothetical protein